MKIRAMNCVGMEISFKTIQAEKGTPVIHTKLRFRDTPASSRLKQNVNPLSVPHSYSLDYEYESTGFSVVLDNNLEVWLTWFYLQYVPRYSHNNFYLQLVVEWTMQDFTGYQNIYSRISLMLIHSYGYHKTAF